MNIRSKSLPAEEAAVFEQGLLDRGFLNVVKAAPEELHPKEYLKYLRGESDIYDAADFTFIWVEPKTTEETKH